MMIAKPSPNPRSARAPYRQRISGGVLVGNSVIEKPATGSGGCKNRRKTCLTSGNGARQRLAARQLTGRLPMPEHPCRYHAHSEQTTASALGSFVMSVQKWPQARPFCNCRNIACQVALRRGRPLSPLANGVQHDREREKPQRPLPRYAEGYLLRRKADPEGAAEDGKGRPFRQAARRVRKAPRRDRRPG